MIILQVIHDFLDRARAGSEIYTYHLTKELVKKGHRVAFFFCEPCYTLYSNKKFIRSSYEGINTYKIRKWPLGELSYNDYFIERCFEETLQEVRPDIVHFQHLYGMSLRLPEIAKRNGLPTVFTLHDFWLGCPMIRLYNYKHNLCTTYGDDCTRCSMKLEVISQGINVMTNYQRWESILNLLLLPRLIYRLKDYIDHQRRSLMQNVIDNIDLFIAPSTFLKNVLVKDIIPEEKVACLSYGVDAKEFQGIKRQPSGDIIRVMYIGQVARHKGVDILIKAFNGIKDKRIELKIYGKLRNPFLKRLIKNQSIKLMGVVKGQEKIKAFSNADLLVFPSIWYENQPLVILEALSARLPVITSNIGGMAELIKDHVNGLLFKVGDRDDLREKLEYLIANPEKIDEMANNIDTSSIGTLTENAGKVEKIYLGLLERQKIAVGGTCQSN